MNDEDISRLWGPWNSLVLDIFSSLWAILKWWWWQEQPSAWACRARQRVAQALTRQRGDWGPNTWETHDTWATLIWRRTMEVPEMGVPLALASLVIIHFICGFSIHQAFWGSPIFEAPQYSAMKPAPDTEQRGARPGTDRCGEGFCHQRLLEVLHLWHLRSPHLGHLRRPGDVLEKRSGWRCEWMGGRSGSVGSHATDAWWSAGCGTLLL